MAKVIYHIHAELEDAHGNTSEELSFDVQADQRDVAAWEAQPFGRGFLDSTPYIYSFLRFMAYHAGKRRKLHSLTWDQFNERCVEANVVDQEGEDATTDPGQPAASAGTS